MTVRVLPAGSPQAAIAGTRSHLDDGRVVVWTPPCETGGHACDAERFDRPPRAALVDGLGLPSDPLGFAIEWTRREVRAKLNDEPILMALRDGGADGAVRLRTFINSEARLVVTVGSDGDPHGHCLELDEPYSEWQGQGARETL